MNPMKFLDHGAVQRLLPHSGLALVLESVEVVSDTLANGYFDVRADDPRISGHFGIMPGVLVAEFCHLTGAVLLMHGSEEAMMPILNESRIHVVRMAVPGDRLICSITLAERAKRNFSFVAVVTRATDQQSIASVEFTGSAILKSVFDRQQARRSPV
jgi:3-hydroxymyristoyl/3-hydroxydecanoyl-(acyl carrier protein) dehydratase